jgi:uncharacterized membrane protein YdjX (TVP38/TMEM64 family)
VAAALLAFATLGPGVGASLIVPLSLTHADWLASHTQTILAPVALAVAVLCGLALLPTFVATVLLCWLYGAVHGLLLAIVCTSAAALLGRLLAGLAGRRTVEPVIRAHPRLRVVRAALLGNAFWSSARTVALLRISPVIPFAAVNVVAGLARARLDAFLLGSIAGMMPRAALVAAWSAKLQVLSFDRPSDFGWLIAGIVVTVAVLALLSFWARAALRCASFLPAEVPPPVVATP